MNELTGAMYSLGVGLLVFGMLVVAASFIVRAGLDAIAKAIRGKDAEQ